MDTSELAARVGVMKTLAQYGRFVDTGQAQRLAELFTDVTEYRMAPDVVARSRAEIVPKVESLKDLFATAAGFGRIRHHVTPAVIDVLETGRARAFSYFAAYAAAGVDHWGSYRDELVEIDGDWLFASRIVTLEGAQSTSPVHSFLPRQV